MNWRYLGLRTRGFDWPKDLELLKVSALILFALCLAAWTALGQNSAPGPPQVETPAPPARAPLSLQERADIYMARKDYAEAVEYYQRALRQPGLSNETNASVCNRLGIAYQQQMNFGAARKAYQAAIRRRSDFAEPWNNLGTVYFLQEHFGKSAKYYRHAVQLNPNSASFHLNLGTAYYREKKYSQAVEEYRTSLTLDPDVLTQRSTTGTVMETRSADADFFFYLAKTFANLGRVEEAVRYLRRAFEDGFTNRKRLEEDPDFQKISQHPAYVELVKNPPVPIKD